MDRGEIDSPRARHTGCNPGDLGAPPTLDYHLPTGADLGPIRWSKPEPIPFGPLTNVGYKNSAVFAQRMMASTTMEQTRTDADGSFVPTYAFPESGKCALTLSVGMLSVISCSLRMRHSLSLLHRPGQDLGGWRSRDSRSGDDCKGAEGVRALDRQATVNFLPFEPDLIDLGAAQAWIASGGTEIAELRLPLLERPTMDVAGLLLFERSAGNGWWSS